MAFCKNCGAGIMDGDKFCTRCGAPIAPPITAPESPQPDFYTPPQEARQPEQDEKKPFNKKIIILIAAVAAVLVGVIVGGALVMNNIRHKQVQKRQTIDVKDFVEFRVRGYDTQGEAEISIDYDDFYDAVMKALGGNAVSGVKKSQYATTARKVCNAVSLKATPDKLLSNGDKVMIELHYDEEAIREAGIILEFEAYEEEVQGLSLKRVDTADIFDYVEITYTGMNGNVWVSCENTAQIKGLKDVRFTIDNNYNLSVGDEFTLRVDDYHVSRLLDEYGIELESTSKTYTVGENDVDRYITALSEISDELFETMQEYALEEIEDAYEWNWNMEISDIEYLGMYLLFPNDSNSYLGNYAFMIYTAKVVFHDADRNPVKIYLPVQINNLVRYADGTEECHDWVTLWDDGYSSGDSEADGYLSESQMFLDIFNEENLLSFVYEISGGMRDFYDDPLEELPTGNQTSEENTSENGTAEGESSEEETPEAETTENERI